MRYDLVVAYRIYPKISKKPLFFENDKYKLSDLCLKSFKQSLGNLNIKIFVLLDNCPAVYKELFLKYFDSKDLDFIELDWIWNHKTFTKQIDILLNQNFSEYVYFAEDDYLYLPNTFYKALSAIQDKKVDFVSLYDHIDSYTLNFQKIKSDIKTFGNHHRRSNSSTCLTFLTKKTVLKKTKNIFLTYNKNNYDYCIWISLTKYNLLKFFTKWHLGLLLKTYFRWFWQMFFGKKYNLYTPIPSLCTHLESEDISPIIDWNEIYQELK